MRFHLFHYVKIKADSKNKTRVVNLMLSNDINYQSTIDNSSNHLYFVIKYKDLKRFAYEAQRNGIEYNIVKHLGFNYILLKNKYRFGIILGIVLLVFAVYFNSKIIWKIEVNGNNMLSDDEVLSILERNGFSLGTFIPKIDYDKMQNNILLNEERISWISLNITGNIAKVEIKETNLIDKETDNYYSNIVAKEDGVIVQIKNISGKRVVNTNDVVKKGQLLVSGIIDSQSEGVRYEQAKGEVFAIVNEKIDVKIPYEYEKKEYTGKVVKEKKYKIFSNIINFSLNNNKYNKNYDKIESKKTVKLFGFIELPITVYTTKYYEYEFVSTKRSKEEATELAIKEINSKIDSTTIETRILSKSISTSLSSDGVSLFCELRYITDIAKEVEFLVN